MLEKLAGLKIYGFVTALIIDVAVAAVAASLSLLQDSLLLWFRQKKKCLFQQKKRRIFQLSRSQFSCGFFISFGKFSLEWTAVNLWVNFWRLSMSTLVHPAIYFPFLIIKKRRKNPLCEWNASMPHILSHSSANNTNTKSRLVEFVLISATKEMRIFRNLIFKFMSRSNFRRLLTIFFLFLSFCPTRNNSILHFSLAFIFFCSNLYWPIYFIRLTKPDFFPWSPA